MEVDALDAENSPVNITAEEEITVEGPEDAILVDNNMLVMQNDVTDDSQVFGMLINTEPEDQNSNSTGLYTIPLPDGTNALVRQPVILKVGEKLVGQTIQLTDGTTAVVEVVDKPDLATSDALETKPNVITEDLKLSDATAAYIQAGGLQAVQLEDGSTAYIAPVSTDQMFDTLEASSVSHSGSQIATTSTVNVITEPSPSLLCVSSGYRPPSEHALAMGDKAYKCSKCDRPYTTYHHLKVHERSHTGDRPFRCDFNDCPKTFATSYGLKSHYRVHTGEKPYKCPEENCTKSFKTSGDLAKHIRTHTGERPFRCPFEGCSRSFTTSNIRKVHIRTHTGEKPYKCPEENCGKTFASATNFKNHVRIHTGEKPYVCTIEGCGKRFTEYSSLYKHHVVHTHAKPYVCQTCGKTYRQPSTLAMHRRIVHNESLDVPIELAVQDKVSNEPKPVLWNDDSDHTLVISTDPQTSTLTETTMPKASSNEKLRFLADDQILASLKNGSNPVSISQITTGISADGSQQIFLVTDAAQLHNLQLHLAQQEEEKIVQAESEGVSTVMQEIQEDSNLAQTTDSQLIEETL